MEHRACGAEGTLKLRKTFRLLEGFKNRMSKTLSEMSKEELIALFESLTIKKASLEARRAELEHQLKLKKIEHRQVSVGMKRPRRAFRGVATRR
jgi:hypothetical protein